MAMQRHCNNFNLVRGSIKDTERWEKKKKKAKPHNILICLLLSLGCLSEFGAFYGKAGVVIHIYKHYTVVYIPS